MLWILWDVHVSSNPRTSLKFKSTVYLTEQTFQHPHDTGKLRQITLSCVCVYQHAIYHVHRASHSCTVNIYLPFRNSRHPPFFAAPPSTLSDECHSLVSVTNVRFKTGACTNLHQLVWQSCISFCDLEKSLLDRLALQSSKSESEWMSFWIFWSSASVHIVQQVSVISTCNTCQFNL